MSDQNNDSLVLLHRLNLPTNLKATRRCQWRSKSRDQESVRSGWSDWPDGAIGRMERLERAGASAPSTLDWGVRLPREGEASAVNRMEVIVGRVFDVPVARSSRRSATEIRPARHRPDLGKTRVSRSSRRRNASRGATSPTRSNSEKSTTVRLSLRLNRVHSTGARLLPSRSREKTSSPGSRLSRSFALPGAHPTTPRLRIDGTPQAA